MKVKKRLLEGGTHTQLFGSNILTQFSKLKPYSDSDMLGYYNSHHSSNWFSDRQIWGRRRTPNLSFSLSHACHLALVFTPINHLSYNHKNIWRGDMEPNLYEAAVKHWNIKRYQSAGNSSDISNHIKCSLGKHFKRIELDGISIKSRQSILSQSRRRFNKDHS